MLVLVLAAVVWVALVVWAFVVALVVLPCDSVVGGVGVGAAGTDVVTGAVVVTGAAIVVAGAGACVVVVPACSAGTLRPRSVPSSAASPCSPCSA